MEKPNLIYVKELSAGDIAYEDKLIAIIKKELLEEKKVYFLNIEANNYVEAAENVHKLKHKIGILGLEEGYEMAVSYENNLREANNDLKNNFEMVLNTMTTFLKNL